MRRLNVHEYVSMEIMAAHDIDVPASKMAETPEDAEKACADIMGGDGERGSEAWVARSARAVCVFVCVCVSVFAVSYSTLGIINPLARFP